jgi:hypothetical protein
VGLGVAAALRGGWQHARLDWGEPLRKPLWHWGVLLSALLALVGAALVIYLPGAGR